MGDALDIGAINGPDHTTVAGPHEAMEDLSGGSTSGASLTKRSLSRMATIRE